ncbi:hypothetical protein BaRGS_00003821 [Batillaria attramentaria]|uniref:Uncharacterized protein n=1 Tax=Batillaria attramentaria TaxID=370345 RepID=A0ABD0M098_9CAEN
MTTLCLPKKTKTKNILPHDQELKDLKRPLAATTMASSARVKFAALVLLTVLLLHLYIWRLSTSTDVFTSSLFLSSGVHRGISQEEANMKTYSEVVVDYSDQQSSPWERVSQQPVSVYRLVNDRRDFPDLCKGPVGLPDAKPVEEMDLTRFVSCEN